MRGEEANEVMRDDDEAVGKQKVDDEELIILLYGVAMHENDLGVTE